MSRGVLLLAGVLCAGCGPLDDAGLTFAFLGDPVVFADGETARTLEVCSTASDPKPAVEVAVSASSGRFRPGTGGSAGGTATLVLTDDEPCESLDWVPTLDPGAVRFEGKVGDVLVGDEVVELEPAVVASLRPIAEPPLLDAVEASQLAIRVETATGLSTGSASNGTVVHVELVAREPADAIVALSDDRIVVGADDSVSLYAPTGTTSVTVRVEVDGVSACRTITADAVMAPREGC